MIDVHIQKITLAQAGVALWIECQPANRKVAGLTPRRGTGLGCGPGPQLEDLQGATGRCLFYTSMLLFFSFSLPSFSLKINKMYKNKIKHHSKYG